MIAGMAVAELNWSADCHVIGMTYTAYAMKV